MMMLWSNIIYEELPLSTYMSVDLETLTNHFEYVWLVDWSIGQFWRPYTAV